MKVLLRLLRFVRPYWWASATTLLLIVVLSFLRLGPAWFAMQVIDQAVPSRDLGLAGLYVAGLIGLAVVDNCRS